MRPKCTQPVRHPESGIGGERCAYRQPGNVLRNRHGAARRALGQNRQNVVDRVLDTSSLSMKPASFLCAQTAERVAALGSSENTEDKNRTHVNLLHLRSVAMSGHMKTERLPLFLRTPLECPNKSDDPAHDRPSESDVEHEDDRLLWMPVPLSDDAGCKIYKDDRKLRYEPTTKGESGLDPVD